MRVLQFALPSHRPSEQIEQRVELLIGVDAIETAGCLGESEAEDRRAQQPLESSCCFEIQAALTQCVDRGLSYV